MITENKVIDKLIKKQKNIKKEHIKRHTKIKTEKHRETKKNKNK